MLHQQPAVYTRRSQKQDRLNF